MPKPDQLINFSNAFSTIRYLLNLDVNAVDEKFLKMGISTVVDLSQTKRLCFYVNHTDDASSKAESLVKHAITLTTLLNEEAKSKLIEFLVSQSL